MIGRVERDSLLAVDPFSPRRQYPRRTEPSLLTHSLGGRRRRKKTPAFRRRAFHRCPTTTSTTTTSPPPAPPPINRIFNETFQARARRQRGAGRPAGRLADYGVLWAKAASSPLSLFPSLSPPFYFVIRNSVIKTSPGDATSSSRLLLLLLSLDEERREES